MGEASIESSLNALMQSSGAAFIAAGNQQITSSNNQVAQQLSELSSELTQMNVANSATLSQASAAKDAALAQLTDGDYQAWQAPTLTPPDLAPAGNGYYGYYGYEGIGLNVPSPQSYDLGSANFSSGIYFGGWYGSYGYGVGWGYGFGYGYYGYYGYGFSQPDSAAAHESPNDSSISQAISTADNFTIVTPTADDAPDSGGLGAGVFTNGNVTTVVPIQTIDGYRDSLFDQTNPEGDPSSGEPPSSSAMPNDGMLSLNAITPIDSPYASGNQWSTLSDSASSSAGSTADPTVFQIDYGAGAAWSPPVIDVAAAEVCFAAGTLVRTRSGSAPIESMREGDDVYCVPEGAPVESVPVLRKVRAVHRNAPRRLLDVELEGWRIRCTAEHRYWTGERGWIEARDLRAGDRLLGDDGRCARSSASATVAKSSRCSTSPSRSITRISSRAPTAPRASWFTTNATRPHRIRRASLKPSRHPIRTRKR